MRIGTTPDLQDTCLQRGVSLLVSSQLIERRDPVPAQPRRLYPLGNLLGVTILDVQVSLGKLSDKTRCRTACLNFVVPKQVGWYAQIFQARSQLAVPLIALE